MAGVDLQGLTATVFGRLKTDALGSAVRAKLGIGAVSPATGADSVLHAHELNKATLPARPLLALRGGPMPGRSYDMRIPTWSWWIYDDPDQGYWRINELVLLIEQAYPRNSIGNTTIGLGSIEVANVFDETSDTVLEQFSRRLQLAFYTRG